MEGISLSFVIPWVDMPKKRRIGRNRYSKKECLKI